MRSARESGDERTARVLVYSVNRFSSILITVLAEGSSSDGLGGLFFARTVSHCAASSFKSLMIEMSPSGA